MISPRLVLLGTIGLALCGCQARAVGRPVADGPARLGMLTNVELELAEPGPAAGRWLQLAPMGAATGPEPNPDGVMETTGQIDLNGDGRAETLQIRQGGAGWADYAVFTASRAGTEEIFRGRGRTMLVSKDHDVSGWPVLAMLTRDYDAASPDAEKVTPDQVWTGSRYSEQSGVDPDGTQPRSTARAAAASASI